MKIFHQFNRLKYQKAKPKPLTENLVVVENFDHLQKLKFFTGYVFELNAYEKIEQVEIFDQFYKLKD